MACCKHWVHQVIERCRYSRPEGDGSCRDEFERLDQPHDRPGWVLEAVDQDCRRSPKPLLASFRQSVTALRSSGYGERIFLAAVSSQSPLSRPRRAILTSMAQSGSSPHSEVALVPASRVASLPRAGVDATANEPHLGQRQRYGLNLLERTNPGLIEASGGTAARCLWASVISGFYASSDVMNDLTKLRVSKATLRVRARLPAFAERRRRAGLGS